MIFIQSEVVAETQGVGRGCGASITVSAGPAGGSTTAIHHPRNGLQAQQAGPPQDPRREYRLLEHFKGQEEGREGYEEGGNSGQGREMRRVQWPAAPSSFIVQLVSLSCCKVS